MMPHNCENKAMLEVVIKLTIIQENIIFITELFLNSLFKFLWVVHQQAAYQKLHFFPKTKLRYNITKKLY